MTEDTKVILQAIATLDQTLSAKIDKLDARLTSVESKIDGIHRRIDLDFVDGNDTRLAVIEHGAGHATRPAPCLDAERDDRFKIGLRSPRRRPRRALTPTPKL